MNKPPSIKRLHEIAAQSREEFESGSISDKLLEELIDTYATDYAEGWKLSLPLARPRFPNFNCGLASVYLRHKAGLGDIMNGRYETKLHTF